MKITFILKNLSEVFFTGNGGSITGWNNLSDTAKFDYLCGSTAKDLGITCKIGNGSFRDRVELNSMRRNPCKYEFTVAPRRGYRLVTFEVSKI